ncbi:MAG: class I SAM-dependent methyltransferase [Acidimicrobiales bacterium]
MATPRRRLLPSYPPPDYLGQLDPEFQARQAARRGGADLEDFVWYHTFELPDGRVVPGAWDLRGSEGDYLGGVDLAGKRVLELGPATGYLTFHMERLGAEVVAFETGFDVGIDVLPYRGREDPDEKAKVMVTTVDRNHDAWWHMHKLYGSKATLVQGSIYDLPSDLGTFDVTLVGAILLHLREPWGALRQAARRTTGCMIVTEPLQDDVAPPESNVMRFSPSAESHLTNWWSIYPGAVVSMLERLGFGQTVTTFHTQRHHLAHEMSNEATGQRMYTVVGRPT